GGDRAGAAAAQEHHRRLGGDACFGELGQEIRVLRALGIGVPLHEAGGPAGRFGLRHTHEGPFGLGAHVHQDSARGVVQVFPRLLGREISGICHGSPPSILAVAPCLRRLLQRRRARSLSCSGWFEAILNAILQWLLPRLLGETERVHAEPPAPANRTGPPKAHRSGSSPANAGRAGRTGAALGRTVQPVINPSRSAMATASVRECASSLAMARETCTLTVFSLMNNSLPAARFVNPRATRSSTAFSRGVSKSAAAICTPATRRRCRRATNSSSSISGAALSSRAVTRALASNASASAGSCCASSNA